MSRLFRLYEQQLKVRPKLTNSIMTGALFGIGDVSAQLFFPTSPELPPSAQDIGSSTPSYDIPRTMRAVVYGSMIFSFIGDKWYRILNSKVRIKGLNPTDWRNMVLKVGVDQLGFAPLGLPFYFGCMSLLEGKGLGAAQEKIKLQWWDTLKTNWCVWPMFQLINFSLVPVQHRLLAANVVAIFWNTFLSYTNSQITSKDHRLTVQYPPTVQ